MELVLIITYNSPSGAWDIDDYINVDHLRGSEEILIYTQYTEDPSLLEASNS